MKRVHITLVGGQPMPVFLGIKKINPDVVVLIYSSDTINLANRIKNEFPNIDIILKELTPVDLAKIENVAKSLFKYYEHDEVSLNISGGTKPWSYYFTKVFEKHNNFDLLYVDQNCIVSNLETKNSSLIDFDIEAQFRLNDNPLTEYTKFDEYTPQDIEAISIIEKIRNSNNDEFKLLTSIFPIDKVKEWNNILKNKDKGKFELSSGSYIEFRKEGYVCICLTNKKSGKAITEIKSPHAVNLIFNYNWFELKIAHLLSQWKQSHSIYHNCHFKSNNGMDKNEVDLIVNTGSKLLFVECKTQIHNTTDIDKFRTVVKNYGGMGSKALFITDGKFNDIALQKCEDSQIIPFSLNNSYMNMSVEKALFLLLERELFNINTK